MRQAIVKLADRRGDGDHPGLILQRYLTKQDNAGERRALLDAVRKAARNDSLRAMYAAAFARWTQSFPEGKAHQAVQLATTGRLVVGLGAENVLETGLRLHHTYGVPLIPGSALKGLASHYCHEVWGQRHDEKASEENLSFRRGGAHHSLLFGITKDGGVIAFHDAWLMPESLNRGALCLDIMTPHHPNWQTNAAPPSDFDSPIPVSFLSVSGTFEVRLSWSGPAGMPPDQAEAWTALAIKLVQEALAGWGVGGKTSSGYGRLTPLVPASTSNIAALPARQVPLPRPGETVEAQLLEVRTRSVGWRALHEPSGLAGPINNTADVPSDKKPGDTLNLIIASANQRGLAFRYPTPSGEKRAPAHGQKHDGSGKGIRR